MIDEDLSAMTDEELENVLKENLFFTAPDSFWRNAMSKDHIRNVQQALVRMLSKVDAMLENRRDLIDDVKDDLENGLISSEEYTFKMNEYRRWRQKAKGFRTGVVSRLSAVTPKIKQYDHEKALRVQESWNALDPDFRERYVEKNALVKKYRTLSRELANAVFDHKQSLMISDDEPTEFDEDLWEVLELEHPVFKRTLADLFSESVWKDEDEERDSEGARESQPPVSN